MKNLLTSWTVAFVAVLVSLPAHPSVLAGAGIAGDVFVFAVVAGVAHLAGTSGRNLSFYKNKFEKKSST